LDWAMLIFEMNISLPWNHCGKQSFLFWLFLNGNIIPLHQNATGHWIADNGIMSIDKGNILLLWNIEGEEIVKSLK
jgi:hypothetical protein